MNETKEMKPTFGKIKVAKVDYINKKFIYHKQNGYLDIFPLTEGSKHYKLSPYSLTNDDGHIMENIWQFSKIYENVPAIVWKAPSAYKGIEIACPAEKHLTNGEPNKDYLDWQEKGFNCPYPVRYPVGYAHRHLCKFVLKNGNKLNKVESRKQVYATEYIKLVRKEQMFKDLVEQVKNGQDIMIHDVDGPHEETNDYYQKNYKCNKFIDSHTVDVKNLNNMKILLNDTTHSFGHGYCLGLAILEEIEGNVLSELEINI